MTWGKYFSERQNENFSTVCALYYVRNQQNGNFSVNYRLVTPIRELGSASKKSSYSIFECLLEVFISPFFQSDLKY